MKLYWHVEDKVIIRSDRKRMRIVIKNNILKKLSGSSWRVGNDNEVIFKDGKAYLNNSQDEIKVFCGPTGGFELVDSENGVLIINFLQLLAAGDDNFKKKADEVLAQPVGAVMNKENTQATDRIELIAEIINDDNSNNYDLIELIYVNNVAKDKLYKELGGMATGSMESQFIKPLRSLRENGEACEYADIKVYIKDAIEAGNITVQYGIGDILG